MWYDSWVDRGVAPSPPSRRDGLIPALYEPSGNPALIYLAALRPASRRAMRSALNRVAGELFGWQETGKSRTPTVPFDQVPWHDLRFQHTSAIRARLADRHSPAAANQSLSALREVLKNASRIGLLPADDYQRAVDLRNVRSERLPAGRALSKEEFHALLRACQADRATTGLRDAALFGTAYVGGLRRSELVALDLADWTTDTGELRVRAGKGNKDRIVFLRNGAGQAFRDWIAVRGDWEGPVFVAVGRSGKLGAARLTPQAVFAVCQRRALDAGIRRFTPHDLRRTCASDMLDAGEDLATVQRHLGHASVQTTARYDRRGDDALVRAAARLPFPYESAD